MGNVQGSSPPRVAASTTTSSTPVHPKEKAEGTPNRTPSPSAPSSISSAEPLGSSPLATATGGSSPSMSKFASMRVSQKGKRKEKKLSRAGSTLLKLRSSSSSQIERELGATKDRIEALFARYRAVEEDSEDADELELAENDAMGPNGMALFLEELGLPEDNIVAFVVAWKLNCVRASRISQSEFLAGLQTLQCDSIESLQKMIPLLEGELAKNRRAVFAYAFKISRPENCRTLDLESYSILLELFLPTKLYPLTGLFVAWLTQTQQSYRALNSDQYINFFDFSNASIATDFSNYDAEEMCWPSIIDEFVHYETGKQERADGCV